MKTILITGINGFLGSSLAKKLKHNYKVIGLEHSCEDLCRIKDEGFNLYFSKDISLDTIFEENEIDVVIHTATLYRSSQIANVLESNILLPVRLFELATERGISLFINTDSFFNDPKYSYSYLQDYTRSKKHCLEWLKAINRGKCRLINMKIFHMYGKDDADTKFVNNIINQISGNTPLIEATLGEQKRDFIYIDDVVTAYETIISCDKIESFLEIEVGTGKATSVRDFILSAKEIVNSKTDIQFGKLSYRENEIMHSCADISFLTNLGWKPQISVPDGIKKMV